MLDRIKEVLKAGKDLDQIQLSYLILRELETLNKKKKDRITDK